MVTILANDPEATAFGNQLLDALRRAGWDVSERKVLMVLPTPVGLKLRVASFESPPVHTLGLQQSLAAIGLSAPAQAGKETDPDTVNLVVGTRPMPDVSAP